MPRLPARDSRRPAAATAEQRGAERPVEILFVALLDADRGRQVVGLLVSQVHSIVRVDGLADRVRPASAAGGWEIVYEGQWIPVHHLGESLGLAPGAPELPDAAVEPVHLLALRNATEGRPGQPGYIGYVIDEVVEIARYPLGQIRPFPRWVVTQLPPHAIWGAVLAGEGRTLLLLDGIALAGQYRPS